MGFIYLLMTNLGEQEVHKIGVTKNSVLRRVSQLQTGNSNKIEILHIYESKNYKLLEKWLHGRFDIYKTEADNEWFSIQNQHVLDFINICKKGDEIINFMLKENHFFNKKLRY